MNDGPIEHELRQAIFHYGEVFKSYDYLLKLQEDFSIPDEHLATALFELYATQAARQIHECLAPTRRSKTIVASSGVWPKYETVQDAARDLSLAVVSKDEVSISYALEAMGVFSVCPDPEQASSTLEDIVSHVNGPAQQVFLVFLALSAARVGDFQRAGKYIEEARAFEPSSRELYDICVVDGLIALNAGNVKEAVRCLDNSMRACQADVDSSVQCALLTPDLEIAAKLLELDERVAVLRYLFECHNVWQSLRPQIEGWIHSIESEEVPDFRLPESDSTRVSRRMFVQWIRACSLQMNLNPANPRKTLSSAEVLAERERQHSEYKPHIDALIKKQLKYLEKDVAFSPDQPPSNPADPRNTE